MQQTENYEVPSNEHMVCKLKKSLYGLKQAPRQWYKKFDVFMCRIEFHKSYKDERYYFKKFDNSYVILLFYMDDMLIAGSSININITLKPPKRRRRR